MTSGFKCRGGETVNTAVLKTAACTGLWVQLPPSAPDIVALKIKLFNKSVSDRDLLGLEAVSAHQ